MSYPPVHLLILGLAPGPRSTCPGSALVALPSAITATPSWGGIISHGGMPANDARVG